MIDNDQEFAKKLTAYLDVGAAGLRAGTAYSLQQARAKALARLAERARVEVGDLAPAMAGVRATIHGAGGNRTFWQSGRLWFGILLIVGGGVGYQQWQAYQEIREIEETDAALLSSDLPIDAYLDRGFQNWLRADSR